MLGLFVGAEVLACLVCPEDHPCGIEFSLGGQSGGEGDSRPGYDDCDVVEQADLCEFSDRVLMF